jgi:hypothetical protein
MIPILIAATLAASAPAQLPARAGVHLLNTARAAFSDALQVTTALCAVVAALTAVLTFVALRTRRTGAM